MAAVEAKLNKTVQRVDAEGEVKYRQVAGGYQYDYAIAGPPAWRTPRRHPVNAAITSSQCHAGDTRW